MLLGLTVEKLAAIDDTDNVILFRATPTVSWVFD